MTFEIDATVLKVIKKENERLKHGFKMLKVKNPKDNRKKKKNPIIQRAERHIPLVKWITNFLMNSFWMDPPTLDQKMVLV